MSELKQLRDKIDEVDAAIIKKLAERQNLIMQVGQLKAKTGRQVLDVEREKQLADYHKNLSLKYDVDPQFTQALFELIMSHSRKLQA